MTGASERFLVISTMKNEGPYVLEWLAWHRTIGFSDVLIYSNDCDDGTDLLLDRLHALGEITHVRNKVLKRGPHKSALKYAQASDQYQGADWVFVCDIDEFLNIHEGDGNVGDLLSRFPDADAIPVPWRMFSNNGHAELSDTLTVEAFTDGEPAQRPDAQVGRFVKTLFRRSEEVERLGLHGPVYAEGESPRWRSSALEEAADGDPNRPSAALGFGAAQVNHYAVRSVDAYLIKRDRGRANHVGDTLGTEYWDRWCIGGETDTSILRQRDRLVAEIDRLKQDPIVAYLDLGTKAWHRKRLQELLDQPDYAELRDRLVAKTQARSGPLPAAAMTPTANLALKAPKRHQNRLRMLRQMPPGGRCAEIGVWDGGFSGAILDVTDPSELVLIDPWDLLAQRDSSEWTHKKHQEAAFMAGMRRNVDQRYGHLANVTIRQGFSAEVLQSYPDGYFDWVYIDGNHLYRFVREDLEIARTKVRKGGIIAGDDFFWKRDGRMHVRDAVLDALRDWGGPNRPSRIGQQYMITVE